MQQSDWPGIWSEEVLLDMVGRIAANNFGIYFGKRRQQTGSAAEPQQQHPVQQQHQGSLAHQNQGGMKQQQHQGSLTHQNQSSTKEEQQHQQQVGAPEHQQEPVDSDLCKHANGGGCNALSNGQGREQPQQQMQAASLEGHPSPAEASTSSHAGLPGATGKSNALLMWPMQEARSEATDAASPSEQSLAQATNGLQRWSCQCPELTSEHQHESITPSHKPSAAALQGFLNSAQHPSQATGRHTVCRDEAGAQLPGHTVENGNTEKGKTEDSKATQQLPLYGTSSRSLVQNSAADPAAALSGGEEVIGREMYITASLFNHSCEPNCVKRREQGQALGQAQSMAAVTALRDIEVSFVLLKAQIRCNPINRL